MGGPRRGALPWGAACGCDAFRAPTQINGIDNQRISGIVNPMTPTAGRPEIGTPINIRLGDDLLTRVDDYAARQSITRAQALRGLVQAALSELDDETLGGY